MKKEEYLQTCGFLKRIGIALDQALSCCIKLEKDSATEDHFGMPDEMLSARAWRLRTEYPDLVKWIDRLFFWDDNHCEECYRIEKDQAQLPDEYHLSSL